MWELRLSKRASEIAEVGKYGEKSKAKLEGSVNMHMNNTTRLFVCLCLLQRHGCIYRCLEVPAVGLEPVNLLKVEEKAAGGVKLAPLQLCTWFHNLRGIHFIENPNGHGNWGVSGCGRAMGAEHGIHFQTQ